MGLFILVIQKPNHKDLPGILNINPLPITLFFVTIPNSKKLQTTTEMWLLKDFKDTDCKENIVKKGEIAHFGQFYLFPQCFPKLFHFNVSK